MTVEDICIKYDCDAETAEHIWYLHQNILTLEDTLRQVRGILKKYQGRYHAAEHAQKDWKEGDRVLKLINAIVPPPETKQPKEGSPVPPI